MKTFCSTLFNVLIFLLLTLFVASCGADGDELGKTDGESNDKWHLVEVEVIDYSPAPGQFVNVLPAATEDDNDLTMRQKCTDALNSMNAVTLGGWGGSITIKLVKPIYNRPGCADFRVLGNAVLSGTLSSKIFGVELPYGSCEPGVVYVMTDKNGNGKPDDAWVELEGLLGAEASSADYSATYSCEDFDAPTYFISDASGMNEIMRLTQYHSQPYFPVWEGKHVLEFRGRLLKENVETDANTGIIAMLGLEGYADCFPNNDERSKLWLETAVDANGLKASVERVDFVKIVTGVMHVDGVIGESSTEICGIECL